MSNTSNTLESNAMGLEAAKMLLDIKAVNFRPDEPYILTSGWASPVYIDCRKLISYPKERHRMMQLAVTMLDDNIGFKEIDAVAGGETAGIPYAAWISHYTEKPMLYVRKKPKGFGRNAQIEGDLSEGSQVLLVEDLATDGASKVTFVNALRGAGAVVSDAFVVFFYGVFSGALESLEKNGITMHYLATWHDVLQAAEQGEYFPKSSIEKVRGFLKDPAAWSKENGGKSE
jgi:orotate phosphoribosyltransferase